jgi:ABC-type lipoprotein export system ATPase subunit
VVVGGTHIYQMTESQRSLWRGRNLGIVFQFFQLLPMLSLHENVMLPMDYTNTYPVDERPERAMELLKVVGLEEQAYKLPAAVSTGQQQSAAIARALATDPPIIVADEPTGNLDSKSASVIIDMFDTLVNKGKTIVMVTHDPSLTERTSRTIVISDGILINEVVARALPLLTHSHMLEVSTLLQKSTYPASATILDRNIHVENFFMIGKGQVEVVLQGRRKEDIVIASLGPGQFFGEMELIRGGRSVACVRAGPDMPVELLSIGREDFRRLLTESPLTEESIGKIVQKRLEENRAIDRRGRFRLFGR